MWDLPGPGLEPVSPLFAGGFLTTSPPGKPHIFLLMVSFDQIPQIITNTKIQTVLTGTLPQGLGVVVKSGLEVSDLLLVLKQ